MYFLKNLCFVCLSSNHKLTSQRNLTPNILEIFEYIIPEYAFYDFEIPNFCDNCLNSLKDIISFRQRCLQNIKIRDDYVQKLKQENESSKYLSIRMTDVLKIKKYEISQDLQNIERIKSEPNLYEEETSELAETDFCKSESENYDMIDQTTETLEIDKFHIKKEIFEQLQIKEELEEDLNLFENEITNISEIHNMRKEEEEQYIPSDDSTESTAMDEYHIKREINEEVIIKEELDKDSNLFENETTNNSEIHNMRKEEEEQYIPSDDSTESNSQSIYSDINSSYKKRSIASNKRPHKCDVCWKTFKRSSHLKRHNLIHTGDKPHSCETCNKSFTRLSALKKHNLIHTGHKPHMCEVCHKSFNDLSNMKKHKLTHTARKSEECGDEDELDESDPQSTHSNIDLTHGGEFSDTDERPYKCDVCQKTFKQSGNLTTHYRIHTGQKPFFCDICEKSFADLSTVRRHKRTHSSMKPFQCEVCHKSFRESYDLKKHTRTHTGEKLHQCDICHKSFRDPYYVRIHKITHM